MRHRTYNRILSALLALCLCLQTFPLNGAATSEEPLLIEETIAESVEETTVESTEESTMESTVESTEGATEEPAEPPTEETTGREMMVSSGETPWEIITANGGPKTPYAFGPNIHYGSSETPIDSMELLKTWLNSYHKSSDSILWSEDGTTLVSMPVEDSAQLILLSVTDPRVYQNATLASGDNTGQISIQGTVGESTLTFRGFGSEEYPFQGTLNQSSFTVERTLFNALDYRTDSFANNTLTVEWVGGSSTGAIVASRIIGSGAPLTVNINSAKQLFRDAAFGTIEGSLDLSISFSSGISFENKSSADNAGMVANTVSNGTLTLSVSAFPKDITIGIDQPNSEKNNAGLLVGRLNNASLTLNSAITPPTATIQAAQGAAGGIVGRIDGNTSLSALTLNGDVDLSNATILGKYSGGIAGYAQDVAFTFGEKRFTLPATLGIIANNIVGTSDVSSQYTGGIFGHYHLGVAGAYAAFDGTGFVYPTDGITLGADRSDGAAGGLFGLLELGTGCVFSVSGTADNRVSIKSALSVLSGPESFGALVGKLKGNGAANELSVTYTDASVNLVSTAPQYLGGLVGSVEKAALRAENVGITAISTSASSRFGGLVGLLGNACVLKTEDTVTVHSNAAITKGGGLVGHANSGSVVRLSGTTNLSDVSYTADANVGQLVGTQNASLLFAAGSGSDAGWSYLRSTSQARVDDIGNYGQVIRLGGNLSSDLIALDSGNTVVFKGHGAYGTIGSADDFALHAIAFAANDPFQLYNGTAAELRRASVTLTADIDLRGTGIQGLTTDDGLTIFDGASNGLGTGVIFDGGNHKLTIRIGETYGLRNGSDASGIGSGQCYRHGYYGLLGRVNSAIVKNLTIDGSMNIGAGAGTCAYAGFVFGNVNGGYSGGGAVNALENVTVLPRSTIDVDGESAAAYVGGLIGYVQGNETGIKVANSQVKANISYTGSTDNVVLGGVIGADSYTNSFDLTFERVQVGGTISSGTTGNAHVGGLIADIKPASNGVRDKNAARMTLKNVNVTAEVSTSAKTTSGGLLGYYWDNVDVSFDGKGENAPYAITTDGASLTTAGAAAGGLCFAATGRWRMQGKAVDMGSAAFDTKNGGLGLLVCHGERQSGNPGAYSNTDNAKALYLVMDTEWATAYLNAGVAISGSPAVFDEIVAYTARKNGSSYDITLNDAGIISLHTTGDRVNMTSGDRNTYGNRTAYGAGHQTNPNSRYYYNLDRMPTPAGDVDTPEELLLWSVGKYCAANIRGYLPIPNSNTITGKLNMDGYSYYPVRVANTNVDVKNAVITFHNEEIEDRENGNKSTLGGTQHYTMHSGLLLDYYTDKDASKPATLKVTNLTLLGTVGMVDRGSGALICGQIYGYSGTNPAKLELKGLTVDSGEAHLAVADFSSNYAPLLMNQAGSHTVLNISGVTAEETTSAGATSLMGDVSGQNINLSFSAMKLPDKNGRFTKATMLNSLQYSETNVSAVYNFTKAEDWNGAEHLYNVTYGQEIGGTVEYADSISNPHQYHYAQSEENVSHTGNHFSGENRDSFENYLPYVATFRVEGYGTENGYHELQVNASLKDINTGCGTYGDPYRISEPSELQSIAMYLGERGASVNWTLNIPQSDSGRSAFCSGAEEGATHVTYRYTGAQWVEQNPSEGAEARILSDDTVRAYLRNAYYQITQNIALADFPGLGTRAAPFRGVVVGKTGNETVTLGGKLPQGFIPFSYGSVVKNLKFSIEGTTTVSFQKIQDNAGYTSESYYGGVIGCILGGDNIIDDVAVSYTGNNVSLGSDKPYLIPLGGYVGVISGGGVIFRGENALVGNPNGSITNQEYFYANPYVGRVIQGFAVQEGTGTKLDNSDKNYQICKLASSNPGITVSGNTITLSDAQALLIFSSVTNSGGAGGGGLLPYFTNACTSWNGTTFGATSVGGKVRNAAYDSVGTASANTSDYVVSLKDDFSVVSATNASYLDTHYAGGQLFNVCGASQWQINLAGGVYDMTGYGNGYRSISPRYLANAVCSSATVSTVGSNYQYLNPLLSGFNGNGATIKTNIVSREYVDDDHHAIAVGGIFNTLRFSTDATMQNVTIGGTAEGRGTISHEYYEWNSSSQSWINATHKNWGNTQQGYQNLTYAQGRGLIAVGGFAGNTTAEKKETRAVSFQSVNTKCLYVKGPFDAGGIIGHTGLRVSSDKNSDPNYNIFSLVGTADITVVPSFQNCTYQNLEIDGGWMVGGYLGFATYQQDAPAMGKIAHDNTISISFDSESNSVLGADSRIHCQRAKTDAGIDKVSGNDSLQKCLPAVGGLIGCSSFKVTVDNTIRAVIRNVEVRSTRSAGGVIAWPFNDVKINHLSLEGSSESPNQIGDLPTWKELTSDGGNEPGTICEFAGGLVGYFEASSKTLTVTNCTVSNLLILASLRNSYPCYAGGIVGNINSAGNHQIVNCKVSNLTLANVKYKNSSKIFYRGGLIGRLQSGNLYGVNLLVDSIRYSCSDTDVYGGNLLGAADSGKTVYLAGVSIQNTKPLDTVLQTDIGGTKPDKCYVAYADYTGAAQRTESTVNPQPSNAGKQGNGVTGAVAPFVTTSPRGVALPIIEGGTKSTLNLYGDGANPEIVRTIFDEKAKADRKKFYYSAADTMDCDYKTTYSSTFYKEMGLTAETADGIPDFPVLQVPVSDKETVSKQIVDYLNLVTNGAYSTARSTSVGANEHVNSESIDLYRWNPDANAFEKNPADGAKAFSGSGDSFETSFTIYDSGKNQFELLTVTFTEKDYSYQVLVPLVVRRMLEVDFTATLRDSPSFKESDYQVPAGSEFNSNITVGYGVSVSALLRYTYNQALGDSQTFGWQTHLNNGGFMGDPQQTIQFYNPNSKLKSLPTGTQLILLDCADNNKAYRYQVPGQSEKNGTRVKLSEFRDAQGNPYPSRWLSEIMNVTAEEKNTGQWVKLNDSADATARIRTENGYQYFRPKAKDDTENLVHLTAEESQPTEQFYLVIYIPESSVEGIPITSEEEGKNLNGYISTILLPGGEIACNVNAVREKSDKAIVADPHSSSESTYNFLSGYTQTLSDQSSDKAERLENDPEAYILLNQPEDDGNYLLHMDLVDEITVVKGQKDSDKPLYFKESVSLPSYAKTDNDAVSLVTANGFPTGCYGNVEFFVYLQDSASSKTYYTWNGNAWIAAAEKQTAVQSCEWVSDGGKMELNLNVDLAGIRRLAKEGNEKFYVETKLDIHMSVPAAEQVIAGSITKGNAYTKLNYTTYLASSEDGFTNTDYVVSKQGEVRYYQSRSGNSTISHTANDPTQLGINCSDLASASGVIYTTGIYDLSTLSNAEKLIADADRVVYSLTLWRRQADGGYAPVGGDMTKYLRSVQMHRDTVTYSDGYQWTDTASDNRFSTADPENSKRFLLPIRVQVNTDVETNGVTFANYQLRLTATLYKGNEILDQPINSQKQVDGQTEYIRHDYVTYSITRILTEGYWES